MSLWAVPEPLLPVSSNRCGRWRDHRQVINGIIHRLGSGLQWRELLERFGRGRQFTSGTCCGRPTAPGRGSAGTSRPPPMPRATLTGTQHRPHFRAGSPARRRRTQEPATHLRS
ncbi:transposase [Streptomyces sp. AM8-1-1]|uniref:transposase n=1 Tax=Streptomyces sp. AM8-1-1 TaxID=3075825 RepID=UPI0039B6FA53